MRSQVTHRLLWASAFIVTFCCVPAKANDPTPAQLEFFEQKIRPLFAANCKKCHSSEGRRQRGGLTLDSRAMILEGGDNGPAIVPAHPDKSLLVKAVRYGDPDLRMPPKKKLSKQQIADLETWVKMGAPWPKTDKIAKKINRKGIDLQERAKHWSFQPIQRPTVPKVHDAKWPVTPVDHFVLEKLQEKGLKPNPSADRHTLLRRVTFDLIGLPPTQKEIADFVNDKSSNAYEKVVDRLLKSPHYGERWARHWLDLVRYADTRGHEFDFEIPEAYHYRDYVIRAFNNDVPYDQFLREHLAGDLLEKPRIDPKTKTNESMIGTGFWWLGEGKHSPVDVKGDQADRIDKQIDVFSKTFIGLTVACARCHDHKFDAITTRDYYSLVGYIHSSRYIRAFVDDPSPYRKAADSIHAFQEQMKKLAKQRTVTALNAQIDQLAKYLLGTSQNREGWQRSIQQRSRDRKHPLHVWSVLTRNGKALPQKEMEVRRAQLLQGVEASQKLTQHHEVLADFTEGTFEGWFTTGYAFGDKPSDGKTLVFQADNIRPIHKVVAPQVAHSGQVSKRFQGVLMSPTFDISKKKLHLLMSGRGARVRVILDGFQIIRNPIYGGLQINVNHGESPRWYTIDLSMWQGHRAYVEFQDEGDGFVAVEKIVCSDTGPPSTAIINPLVVEIAKGDRSMSPHDLAKRYQRLFAEVVRDWEQGKLAKQPDALARFELLNWMLTSPEFKAITPNLLEDLTNIEPLMTNLLKKKQQAEAKIPNPLRVLAMRDGTPINENVYIRGNHKNLGEEVPRRYLEVFVGNEAMGNEGSGRLALADKLLSPTNTLTARVMVNRLWKHHFGTGIVKSVDNFGILGEKPSHPRLLDWLASEFVNHKWSIKKMHRLIVLSQTYRMSSRPQPAAETIDPSNRLLHRMPVRRLEAEAIRDSLLAVSGRLDKTMYGRGVMPHLTPFMSGRGRPGRSGPLDGNGRRSIYINVRRNFLTPLFMVFDYPTPFSTIGRRGISNVPAQALTMMNNPFVIQQAELLAKRLLDEKSATTTQRIEKMYLLAFGRPPSQLERERVERFLTNQGKQYGNVNDLRAWQNLCHVVVNLKEFIYVQ
ncbi:MAG: PSD1 and planctomycete cytochrome C domain-containing protein [Gemmataceae bacterium]